MSPNLQERRPDFFIVGAPKCGTTAMTRYLDAHPQIFLAERKDLHFFGSDLGFRDKKREETPAYLARFVESGDALRIGESSVWYLYSKRAADEIAAFNPEARILILLRNPVDMMYALFTQLRLNGLGEEDIEDFAEALSAEPERAAGQRIPEHTPLPEALLYRRAATFSEQVARYLAAFPREQVHIVLQEELAADTPGTYRAVLKFLDVDPDFAPDFRRVNAHKEVRSEGTRKAVAATPTALKDLLPTSLRHSLRKTIRKLNSRHVDRTPLDSTLRANLSTEFAPEIDRLADLLKQDLSSWTGD